MDTVWVSTGIWISLGVGGMLLVPVLLEFAKRNLPILFGVIIFLLALQTLAPHSPEIHSLWSQIGQIPGIFYGLTSQLIALILP